MKREDIGCSPGITARRGFTLFEIMIALVLLGVLLAVALKTLGWVAAEHRAAERRQFALHTLANLLERAAATPFETLNDKTLAVWTLPDAAARVLPDAELTSRVEAVGDAKRVSVRLRWRGRSGIWEAPCRLTAFFYHGMKIKRP